MAMRSPHTTKLFNVKEFLAYEEKRSADLYNLARDCWRKGTKRAKNMERALALYSDVSEEEWGGMFLYMLREELKEYRDAAE